MQFPTSAPQRLPRKPSSPLRFKYAHKDRHTHIVGHIISAFKGQVKELMYRLVEQPVLQEVMGVRDQLILLRILPNERRLPAGLSGRSCSFDTNVGRSLDSTEQSASLLHCAQETMQTGKGIKSVSARGHVQINAATRDTLIHQ